MYAYLKKHLKVAELGGGRPQLKGFEDYLGVTPLKRPGAALLLTGGFLSEQESW